SGDGRHGVPAGEWIDELHFPAVAGVRIALFSDPGQRLAAARIRVAENRGCLAERRYRAERLQVVAVAGEGGALATGDRLHVLGVGLVELRGERGDDRQVEAVQPDDRVRSRIAMIVPGP